MMGRTAARRLLLAGSALAFALLVIGVVFIHSASNEINRQSALRSERLLTLDVDLTKPGEYSGQLPRLDPVPCGIAFCLEADPPFASPVELQHAFEGFEASVTIEDSRGTVLRKEPLKVVWSGLAAGPPLHEMLHMVFPWPRDSAYTVRLNVTRPAPALSGQTCKVQVLYLFAGFEVFDASMLRIGGSALLMFSLALALAVVLFRRRWHRLGLIRPTD
jgi:hypothetical protein